MQTNLPPREVAVARHLLGIQAVFLRPNEPFTWASGIKSPIYCDNRLILTAPEARVAVEEAMAALIRDEYPGCEALFGTATAGIAHAAIAAHLMGLPMGYVRGASKDHGRQNRIEGRVQPGQKMVVVEDLISTAGSAIDRTEALREAGCEVLGVASIFTYGMQKGLGRLAAAGLVNHSLCTFDTLAQVAAETGYIESADVVRLMAFRDDPDSGAWMTM
jgi:orotate phosphoribosyltransferase